MHFFNNNKFSLGLENLKEASKMYTQRINAILEFKKDINEFLTEDNE